MRNFSSETRKERNNENNSVQTLTGIIHIAFVEIRTSLEYLIENSNHCQRTLTVDVCNVRRIFTQAISVD